MLAEAAICKRAIDVLRGAESVVDALVDVYHERLVKAGSYQGGGAGTADLDGPPPTTARSSGGRRRRLGAHKRPAPKTGWNAAGAYTIVPKTKLDKMEAEKEAEIERWQPAHMKPPTIEDVPERNILGYVDAELLASAAEIAGWRGGLYDMHDCARRMRIAAKHDNAEQRSNCMVGRFFLPFLYYALPLLR